LTLLERSDQGTEPRRHRAQLDANVFDLGLFYLLLEFPGVIEDPAEPVAMWSPTRTLEGEGSAKVRVDGMRRSTSIAER
jgi:hypothetical protein